MAMKDRDRQRLDDIVGRVVAGELDAQQGWQQATQDVLRPHHPFELHQQAFQQVYSSWPEQQRGPAPVWVPTTDTIRSSNAARFMQQLQASSSWWRSHASGDPASDWPALQRFSCDEPEAFWTAWLQQSRIPFATPPTRILQPHDDPDKVRWLPGARLNIAAAAIAGSLAPAGCPAIIWAAEGTPHQLQQVSWEQLRARCSQVAAAVAARWPPGTPLAINMPLTLEAALIYLGVVLAGCCVVSIADSFSAPEVAARLRIAQSAAIFTQDVLQRGGKQLALYARVKDAAAPTAVVVPADASRGLQVALRPGDCAWGDFLAGAPTSSNSSSNSGISSGSSSSSGGAGGFQPHIADAYDTTNILFSSGTTGEPKAIPWSHVSPLRCAVDGWALQDIRPGGRVAWPTNLGWMMGPWLLYAALLNGATIALYQGAPLGADFCQFVEAARVTTLGLVPSIVKAWRAADAPAGCDWSSLHTFSSSGEASSPEDYHWLASRVTGYRPVIEYCGGTEIAGGFLSGCVLQPQVASMFSTPALGTRLVLLVGAEGRQSDHVSGEAVTGELTLVPPCLGFSQRLLNRDHTATYYADMPRHGASGARLRRHGDEVARWAGGYYSALGRCDDTMNLGGIKVSSVELERVVLEHLNRVVLEAAAVGVPTPGGGPELLHLFLVLHPSAAQQLGGGAGGSSGEGGAQLQQQCQAAVRTGLNPLFKVDKVLVVQGLPRTASNKVMRRVLRDMVQQNAGQGQRAKL